MRKTMWVLCFCLLWGAVLFSQTETAPQNVAPDPTAAELTEETSAGGMVTLRIRYYPITREAIFTYACRRTYFSEDKARNAIRERTAKLAKDKGFADWETRPDVILRDDDTGKTSLFTMRVILKNPRK